MQMNLGMVLLLLPIVSVTAAAQEPDTAAGDDEAPASAVTTAADPAAEREALEPAVPTSPAIGRGGPEGYRVIDEIVLERTEVTGNQELPKVLYIVPWQKSDPGNLTGKPVNTLLDEVLAPIDRSEFIRQVEYYGELYGSDDD